MATAIPIISSSSSLLLSAMINVEKNFFHVYFKKERNRTDVYYVGVHRKMKIDVTFNFYLTCLYEKIGPTKTHNGTQWNTMEHNGTQWNKMELLYLNVVPSLHTLGDTA